ncbi:MAG: PLDc N-terminal domain-containing protein [Acidimicrobiales bacterium]
MFRLAGVGFIGFLLIALWIYCIFDVIASEEVLIRNLPKYVWLMIVFFLPDIGSLAWLALGRPAYAGWRPGDTGQRPAATRRHVAPEDRVGFATPPGERHDDKKLEEWEADLKRREEELKRRRRDEGTGPQGHPGAW